MKRQGVGHGGDTRAYAFISDHSVLADEKAPVWILSLWIGAVWRAERRSTGEADMIGPMYRVHPRLDLSAH